LITPLTCGVDTERTLETILIMIYRYRLSSRLNNSFLLILIAILGVNYIFGIPSTLCNWSKISLDGSMLSERSLGKTRTVDLCLPYRTTCYRGLVARSLSAKHPSYDVLEIRQNGNVVRLQPFSLDPPIDITDSGWAFVCEPFRRDISRFYPDLIPDREVLKADGDAG